MSDKLPEVRATLHIQVTVNCPHCDSYINLLDEDDTDGFYHNEEGHILSQTCPNDSHWSDGNLEVNEVTCSECGKEFNVRGVDW